MLDEPFDFSADLEHGTCKIEWKGEDKNIVKKYSRKDDLDGEVFDADFGSFFNLFEAPEDEFNVRASRGIRSCAMLTHLKLFRLVSCWPMNSSPTQSCISSTK